MLAHNRETWLGFTGNLKANRARVMDDLLELFCCPRNGQWLL